MTGGVPNKKINTKWYKLYKIVFTKIFKFEHVEDVREIRDSFKVAKRL